MRKRERELERLREQLQAALNYRPETFILTGQATRLTMDHSQAVALPTAPPLTTLELEELEGQEQQQQQQEDFGRLEPLQREADLAREYCQRLVQGLLDLYASNLSESELGDFTSLLAGFEQALPMEALAAQFEAIVAMLQPVEEF